MNDCPNCEYHKKRAQLWRDEAYKQAGYPLPEREWVGLTEEEIQAFRPRYKFSKELLKEVERILKEKNDRTL